MAVSNSTDFKMTAQEVVTDARSKLGISADEEPLSASELTRGLRALNAMLKAWEVSGIRTWVLTEGTLTLVQSQTSYAFGTGGDFTTLPFEITDMRITRSGTDLPMLRLSRQEYFSQPNKASEGYPTQWYYDRQRDTGTLYIWPLADATGGTLKFTYRRRIMDMDAGSDDFDFPAEWYEALVYNLAQRMIPDYGAGNTPEASLVIGEAARLLADVRDFDTGEGEAVITVLPEAFGGR